MELSGLHIGKKYIYWGSQCCKNCFIGECLAGKVEDTNGAGYTNLVWDLEMENGVPCGRNWLVGAPHAAKVNLLGYPKSQK